MTGKTILYADTGRHLVMPVGILESHEQVHLTAETESTTFGSVETTDCKLRSSSSSPSSAAASALLITFTYPPPPRLSALAHCSKLGQQWIRRGLQLPG